MPKKADPLGASSLLQTLTLEKSSPAYATTAHQTWTNLITPNRRVMVPSLPQQVRQATPCRRICAVNSQRFSVATLRFGTTHRALCAIQVTKVVVDIHLVPEQAGVIHGLIDGYWYRIVTLSDLKDLPEQHEAHQVGVNHQRSSVAL